MNIDTDLLSKILDSLHNQVVVIDKNMIIRYYNQVFESFLLLNMKENPGIQDKALGNILPEKLHFIQQIVEECFESRTIIQQISQLDYNNQMVFYKIVAIPYFSENGQQNCILILYSITDVELKKKELNQQIQFHEKLIRRLPLGVYMFDNNQGDSVISLWNPRMRDYFDISPQDAIGRSIQEILDKETVKRHMKALEQIKLTGLYYQFPAEYIKTPHGMKYFQTILAPLSDPESPTQEFMGIMEDVTEKIHKDLDLARYQEKLKNTLKDTSDKLSETNAEISSIMENSYGISIFSLDLTMKYRVFNSHHQFFMKNRLNIAIEKGQSLSKVIMELHDKETSFKNHLEAAATGKNVIVQLHYKIGEGNEIFMDAVFSPLFSQNEIIGITVILFDTTEHREAEREAEIFKSVADNADYGVLLTDLQFNILYSNNYWKNLFPKKYNTQGKDNLSDILSEERLRKIKGSIRNIHNSYKKSQIELDIPSKDKNATTILMNYVPYRGIDENVEGFSFTSLDITPMKEAREALIQARNNAERSSLFKSSFVANMSHEIRTPLNAILGFAGLLNEKITDPLLKPQLESIVSSGKILKELVNDILDFSKIEAGKMSYKPQYISILPFFREIYEMFFLQAKKKCLSFSFESVGGIPDILFFDPQRLRQIIINLIGNALKFTLWGSIILKIDYDKDNEQLILDFIDTGIGISQKDQQHIFSPFEQQETKDSRSFEGTGLGLSITKKIIELMNGSIHLNSENWMGSKFRIQLPITCPESANKVIIKETADLYTPELDLRCYIEESLLSKRLRKYGEKNNLHFTPLLQDIHIESSDISCVVITNLTPIENLSEEINIIKFLEKDRINESEKRKNIRYVANEYDEDIKPGIIHSILKQIEMKKSSYNMDFTSLDPKGRELITHCLKTRNFQDIHEALIIMREIEKEPHDYTSRLESALTTFDIPKLNKLMDYLKENLKKET